MAEIAPQRLNTKDLFWLVGFIDGDDSYYKKDGRYEIGDRKVSLKTNSKAHNGR